MVIFLGLMESETRFRLKNHVRHTFNKSPIFSMLSVSKYKKNPRLKNCVEIKKIKVIKLAG